ncbi:MAG: hypothetical protein ACREBC_27425 [Pyrinomonadaceae bacterium]
MTEQTTTVPPLHVPLSELTRKKRRALLGASITEIAIAKLKVFPSKISGFGIEVDFTEVHHHPLLLLISLIVLYFLFAFVIRACLDFVAWSQARNQQALEVATRLGSFLRQRQQRNGSRKEADLLSDNEGQNEGDYAEDLLALYRDKQVRIPWLKIDATVALDYFEFVLPVVVGLYAALLPWFPELHQSHLAP